MERPPAELSTDRGACARPGTRARGAVPTSFAERKQQQLVFTLVGQLAEAQFARADRELSRRLWQEVAALDIDPERITSLLYGGQACDDRRALQTLDEAWLQRVAASKPRRGFRWGWVSPMPRAGGRRSAPPAVPPSHRAAG